MSPPSAPIPRGRMYESVVSRSCVEVPNEERRVGERQTIRAWSCATSPHVHLPHVETLGATDGLPDREHTRFMTGGRNRCQQGAVVAGATIRSDGHRRWR
jgi:hypothetical protein